MRSVQNDDGKLRDILTSVYRGREDVDVDDLWHERVMNHIRQIDIRNVREDFSSLFEWYIWRLVPLVCLLILVIVVSMLTLDLTPEYEMTKALINDPVDYIVGQFWGV